MLRCGVCVIRFRIPWLKIAWRPEDVSINCEAIILKWLWEAFEQYITCKVPPNSPVKLPWLGVKAMIDDEHGRSIFYGSMILKCLGDPPSHVMPGSSKFCLGSSMARHVSGSRGWRPRYVVDSLSDVSMESWFWMNFESPKTHQKHTSHSHTTITLTNFRWFRSQKALQKWGFHINKNIPTSMARLKLRCCHDCCWSGTLLIEVASLLRGVFFLFGLWPQKPQGSGNWTTWRARKARQVHRRLEF